MLTKFWDVIRQGDMQVTDRVDSEAEALDIAARKANESGDTHLVFKQEFVGYGFPEPQQAGRSEKVNR